MNAARLRELLTHTEDNPALFDTRTEAQAVLGLSDDQLWDGGDLDNLLDLPAGMAVERLRVLTEEAEAAIANA